ncbi:MAG: Flp family type IVb pilin [Acidimicrobiales bacterium]
MNEYLRSTPQLHATRGATAVEYALIIALIAAVIIVAVGTLGTKTEGLYNNTNTELTNHGA